MRWTRIKSAMKLYFDSLDPSIIGRALFLAAFVFAMLALWSGHARFRNWRIEVNAHFPSHFIIWGAACGSCLIGSEIAKRKELKRRRRTRAGCCENCGYDLRASKQRCPECSTPIQPAKMYPALPKFFGVYFWEKWREDAESSDNILIIAIGSETPGTIRQVQLQIARFLNQEYDDATLANYLREDFGCHFDPAETGLTTHQWLAHLVQVLNRSHTAE